MKEFEQLMLQAFAPVLAQAGVDFLHAFVQLGLGHLTARANGANQTVASNQVPLPFNPPVPISTAPTMFVSPAPAATPTTVAGTHSGPPIGGADFTTPA